MTFLKIGIIVDSFNIEIRVERLRWSRVTGDLKIHLLTRFNFPEKIISSRRIEMQGINETLIRSRTINVSYKNIEKYRRPLFLFKKIKSSVAIIYKN